MREALQVFAIAILVFMIYQITSDLSRISNAFDNLKTLQKTNAIELNLIAQRLDVRDRERKELEKISKNQELLGDISCGACHNNALSLPIRNISLSEAIEIVRVGNERSIAGGMPRYKNINTGRDEAYISDSGLRNRLKDLYIDDFLKIALDKDYKKGK